jgi:predicted ArsR family transcriptional regulator
MKTRDKILKLLENQSQMTVHELSSKLQASMQYVHRLLSDIEEVGNLEIVSIPPKVYYTLKPQSHSSIPHFPAQNSIYHLL